MGSFSLVPSEPTPKGGGSGAGRAFSQRQYGMDLFKDLLNSRQLLALSTFVNLIRRVGDRLTEENGQEFATAVCCILSMAVGKLADFSSSLCTWRMTRSCVRGTFARSSISDHLGLRRDESLRWGRTVTGKKHVAASAC